MQSFTCALRALIEFAPMATDDDCEEIRRITQRILKRGQERIQQALATVDSETEEPSAKRARTAASDTESHLDSPDTSVVAEDEVPPTMSSRKIAQEEVTELHQRQAEVIKTVLNEILFEPMTPETREKTVTRTTVRRSLESLLPVLKVRFHAHGPLWRAVCLAFGDKYRTRKAGGPPLPLVARAVPVESAEEQALVYLRNHLPME